MARRSLAGADGKILGNPVDNRPRWIRRSGGAMIKIVWVLAAVMSVCLDVGFAVRPARSAEAGQGAQSAAALSFDQHESNRSGFLPLILREAEANGLPAAIADAVVRVESSYNP